MKDDIPKLQAYLRKVFQSDNIRLVMQPKKNDMAEVFVGDEFIAALYREEEDGEVEYQLQMCILEDDLQG
ncbi:MAG: DUF3126 family protein [Hyphomicrobiaceae bacterium]|nr:DUF3126 family protein [Hyphomicrobiaceae bacterium]